MRAGMILTAAQMRRCDNETIGSLGIPSRELMERAARGAADHLIRHPDEFPDRGGMILLLCGGGNNGGDGLAMARFLSDGSMGHPRRVAVVYGGRPTADGSPDPAHMSEECRHQYAAAIEAGVPFLSVDDLRNRTGEDVDAVVDALFGIGMDRPLTGVAADLIQAVRAWPCPVLAMDIPSGVDADSGRILGDVCLPATATVTMQALKRGLVLFPGADLCGHIHVMDIGITTDPVAEENARMSLCDNELLQKVMAPRARRSNKGTYGRVALLVGAKGMAGAAYLTAAAALRCGAGLVDVGTPEANRVILQSRLPEAMVTVVDDLLPSALADRWLPTADGLVVGCGLGRSDEALSRLTALLDAWPTDRRLPLVLDADALNLLATHPSLWQTAALTEGIRNVVITPHPGEMARLCGCSVSDILADLPGAASRLAAERGVTVVLKDAHTVIAAPDGRLYLCTAGHAGLATGGTGDVLAGIIGSLLTQCRQRGDITVAEVAAAGVYLHAKAGEAAALAVGEYACAAGDLIRHIGTVTRGFSDSRTVLSFGEP